MKAELRRALAQVWVPARPFGDAELERAYRADYCAQFAAQRRLAIVLGFGLTMAYLLWDYLYSAGDPLFQPVYWMVFGNRVATGLMLLPFLGLALRQRFERDEAYATAVLVSGVFLSFLFYCNGLLIAPYPYDYMYFFMGMFICVVFGFAMLRLRARPVLLFLGLCLAAAVVTFARNAHLKDESPGGPAGSIYHWVALSFLTTLAMIGYVVGNLLERSIRASFARARQLSDSNEALRLRTDEVERLNGALQDAVARAEREALARSQVLAAASHDLRQPLHALSIYSAVLLSQPSEKSMREVGANISQLASSLGTLLHGLLDVSKLSSGAYVPARQAVALKPLVSQLCEEFRPTLAERGLSLRCELADVSVKSDALAIARVVRNLVDNGIKYTEKGTIAVSLRQDDDDMVLVVADTGCGIAAAEQSRIFEEFYQIGNRGRQRSQGVGLGLAIVLRLVHLMGGTIRVRSEVGQGSAFEVRIPGAASQPTLAAGASTLVLDAATDSGFGGRRVFVVDDEEEILASTRTLFDSWGCETRCAASTDAARLLFDDYGAPDLLIVDLRMQSEATSVAMVDQCLREHGPFAVLVVTGDTSSDALAPVSQRGWPVLHKPVAVGDMQAAARTAWRACPGRPAAPRAAPRAQVEPMDAADAPAIA